MKLAISQVRNGVAMGRLLAAALVAATVLGVACNGVSSPASKAGPQDQPVTTTVTLHTQDGATFVLADERGLTLYYFAGDEPDGVATECEGACATKWTPLTVRTTVVTKPDQLPAAVDTVKRRDGSLQVRYGGRPLYRHAADRAPGERNGEDTPTWTAAHVALACDCIGH